MTRNFAQDVLLASLQDELEKIAAGKSKGLMGLVSAFDRKILKTGRGIRVGRIAIKRAPGPGGAKRDLVLRKGRSDPKWLQGDKRRQMRNMIDRLLGVGVPVAGAAAVGAGGYFGGREGLKAYRRYQANKTK